MEKPVLKKENTDYTVFMNCMCYKYIFLWGVFVLYDMDIIYQTKNSSYAYLSGNCTEVI